MSHLQLLNHSSGQRILLAFYSDNYMNLLPGASAKIVIAVPHRLGQPFLGAGLRIDGWKVDRAHPRLRSGRVPVTFNEEALAVTQTISTFDRC
ncbi:MULTISPECIES: beta-mannosidase [Paraburkholderia]|uniref:beta-mannosidase n=1 Tax=Paraburkholderia TaxID=1822464 RepID=UPI00224FEE44|nr:MULTISPECIES: beta-mannosidase [Paraburkholderia]MCX4160918.1 beta-mannosidase [Paraburkholderia megapolitana]MDN7156414.1 beta-mannosidase [Paraburkholderia sp. CHISQ3]MDQ6493459.1 beta-mannosidase [Paraburkholderia megapolitana]